MTSDYLAASSWTYLADFLCSHSDSDVSAQEKTHTHTHTLIPVVQYRSVIVCAGRLLFLSAVVLLLQQIFTARTAPEGGRRVLFVKNALTRASVFLLPRNELAGSLSLSSFPFPFFFYANKSHRKSSYRGSAAARLDRPRPSIRAFARR